jgi:hypothetical protein
MRRYCCIIGVCAPNTSMVATLTLPSFDALMSFGGLSGNALSVAGSAHMAVGSVQAFR